MKNVNLKNIKRVYSIELSFSKKYIMKKKDRTQTDTGGQVEYTKARERSMKKELGKLAL